MTLANGDYEFLHAFTNFDPYTQKLSINDKKAIISSTGPRVLNKIKSKLGILQPLRSPKALAIIEIAKKFLEDSNHTADTRVDLFLKVAKKILEYNTSNEIAQKMGQLIKKSPHLSTYLDPADRDHEFLINFAKFEPSTQKLVMGDKEAEIYLRGDSEASWKRIKLRLGSQPLNNRKALAVIEIAEKFFKNSNYSSSTKESIILDVFAKILLYNKNDVVVEKIRKLLVSANLISSDDKVVKETLEHEGSRRGSDPSERLLGMIKAAWGRTPIISYTQVPQVHEGEKVPYRRRRLIKQGANMEEMGKKMEKMGEEIRKKEKELEELLLKEKYSLNDKSFKENGCLNLHRHLMICKNKVEKGIKEKIDLKNLIEGFILLKHKEPGWFSKILNKKNNKESKITYRNIADEQIALTNKEIIEWKNNPQLISLKGLEKSINGRLKNLDMDLKNIEMKIKLFNDVCGIVKEFNLNLDFIKQNI